jgi:HNH endonuclease
MQELYEILIVYGVDNKTARRFSDKVLKAESGCWLWQANTGRGGYGRFQCKGNNEYAHRWIYKQIYGDAGESIDHICSQASCVNPNHLQIVTRGQNTRLMLQRGPVRRPKVKRDGPRLHSSRKAIQEGRILKEAHELLLSVNVPEEEAYRFSSKVTLDINGCWVWSGPKKVDGYAIFSFQPEPGKKHKSISGHRWAYIKLIGDPGDLVLDHLCRNRACCNPYHLEPVTRLENSRRADHTTRVLKITHCPYGHPYDESNTRYTKDRKRCCRTCERERANAKKTHCAKGHPYNDENIGYRECTDGKARRYCIVCREKPREYPASCPKGHPYNEENTWIGPKGDFACRICARLRARESKTHCARGHQYAPGSFEIVKGARRCLFCKMSGPPYIKTHCNQGHEFTLENTGYRPRKEGNPYRYCIICDRKKAREYQRKKRAQKLRK